MNLIQLAIASVESETLAENIANMHPSLVVAERIISGIPEPSMKKMEDYIARSGGRNGIVYVSHEINNAFEDSCLSIRYKYPRTVYWDAEYQQDTEVVAKEEYNRMYREHNCRDRESDQFKYKMTYWETNCISAVPEDLCD